MTSSMLLVSVIENSRVSDSEELEGREFLNLKLFKFDVSQHNATETTYYLQKVLSLVLSINVIALVF